MKYLIHFFCLFQYNFIVFFLIIPINFRQFMDLTFLHIMIINIPGIINNIKKSLCELINKVLKSINFKLITDNFNNYFFIIDDDEDDERYY